jgi:histidinol-phosphate/aromatic aminotransferase/cobyric acid decarboxylase-like protein
VTGGQQEVHGGVDDAELRALGLAREDVLDFSVNTNPAPVPDELRRVIAAADVAAYPDSDSHRLRQAAAEAYGVSPEQVIAGNGSSELIWLICLALLSPGDTVLVRQPTFGEYERAARIYRCEVTRQPPAGLTFICNPNNPTGDYTRLGSLPGGLVVVDEAYADFVEGRPTLIGPAMPDNLIVLRSLTKFSALAGLRLGLAFGQPPLIEALRRVKPPWNVNAAAQAAGEYALRHPELLPDLQALARAREALVGGLRGLGYAPQPTDCNFFLVPVGDAAALRRKLLAQGCLVRDCASFGLPGHIRIAVRTPADNQRLLTALEACR